MKRHYYGLSILILASMILGACTSASQGNTAQAGQVAGTQVAPARGTQNGNQPEMPLVMKLALGTFKLEDTAYPVDAAQAANLLPLWKAVRSLSSSETTAPEELNAVYKQIQDTLTAEQLAAIDGMNLSFQDMASIGQEFGLNLGTGQFGNQDPSARATAQAARASGQAGGGTFGGPGGGAGPGGGPPTDGGFQGGQGISPEARQTAIASRGGTAGASIGLNSALLDAVIQFLEGKIQ
jgi:hypothetical protein